MDYQKKYYEKNKIKILQKRKEYVSNDDVKEYQKVYQKKYREILKMKKQLLKTSIFNNYNESDIMKCLKSIYKKE